MPRISLKETERELLFNLVSDSILDLSDRLVSLEDEAASSPASRDEAALVRVEIVKRNSLAAKLMRATVAT